jgi:hypothetical protein
MKKLLLYKKFKKLLDNKIKDSYIISGKVLYSKVFFEGGANG